MNWKIKPGCKYTPTHEWVSFDGNLATVGITDYAQDMLKDIVFIELPDVGQAVKAGKNLAVIESVKAVSDVFSPIDGRVVEINEVLLDQPELLNSDPYGAWVVKIEFEAGYENPSLLEEKEYEEFAREEANK